MSRGHFVLGCLLVLQVTASASDVAQKGSPVQKVISMMNDMMAKAKQEKQDEKVRFAAFSQFCQSTSQQKKEAITKGDEDIEKSESEIEQAKADASNYAKEIAGHEKDMSTWSTGKDNAIALRKDEHAVFEKAHAETVDSLDSTVAAKATLAEGNQKASQAAFAQLSQHSKFPTHMRKWLASFLQTDPDASLVQTEIALMGSPEAAAFEGTSGGIIGVVQGLEDKLSAEKKELEEREANQLNAHNLQVNSLDGDIKKAEMESSMKASLKSQREQDRATAGGELADATRVRAEDRKYLADLTAECEMKISDFHKRQTMRQGEIKAIQKAIEIMSSDDVAGGTKHTALMQKKGVVFAQLRSNGNTERRRTVQKIVANLLESRAQKINSKVLMLLVTHVSSDPFDKVTKMVKDMIKKLMEEANEEADHKAFCDTEMGKNKLTRDTKTALVAQLESTIEQLSADINKLAQRNVKTQQAIAEIDAAMTEATEERQAEKDKNQAAIGDGNTARAATQRALQVLEEYYEKAANQVDLPEADGPIKYDPRSLQILSKSAGGAFVQQQQKVPGAPEMESGKYTGMGNGGIVGMLEIIESDFADLIAETETSEAESARAFEQFKNDSASDKAVKETELSHQQDTKTQKQSDLQTAHGDLRTAQKELRAAVDYFAKLKPDCVEEAMSYEDKVAARKSEIESLQEALQILSQPDVQ